MKKNVLLIVLVAVIIFIENSVFAQVPIINLKAQLNSSPAVDTDDVTMLFITGGTYGWNVLFDAQARMNTDSNYCNIYAIVPGYYLSVYFLPPLTANIRIQLGFSVNTSGNYTITASQISNFGPIKIYLVDTTALGVNKQDLTSNLSYSFDFTTTETDNNTRFYLVVDTPSTLCKGFSIAANGSNASCATCTDGYAWAQVTGGKIPFTYTWDTKPVQTKDTARGLTPGTYNVCITDSNGCSACNSITIQNASCSSFSISANGSNASCNTCADGYAWAKVKGGTPPYSYTWNTIPIQTTDTIRGQTPGTYNVCITDSIGCSACNSITIQTKQPTEQKDSVIIGNLQRTIAGDSISIPIYAKNLDSIGTIGWWIMVDTNQLAINEQTCFINISPQLTGANTSFGFFRDKNIIKLFWMYTGNNASGISFGSTKLLDIRCELLVPCTTICFDKAFCEVTDATVNMNSIPVIYICGTEGKICNSFSIAANSFNASCSSCADGYAWGQVTAGTQPYAYSWNTKPMQTNDSIKELLPGTYHVCVTDVNGCHACDSVTIQTGNCSAYFELNPTSIPHVYNAINMASGVAPIKYMWSWGDGTYDSTAFPSHKYDSIGFYKICLTITDSAGCKSTYCNSYLLKSNNPIIQVNVISNNTSVLNLNKQNQSFYIYPNPTSENINIENKGNVTQNYIVSIKNIEGQEVIKQCSVHSAQCSVNVSGLSNGVYILSIMNNESGIRNYKVVISR